MPVGIDVDQKVQLVQVSATTRTLLDPQRSTPASKLTGMQFHHFGAFYKASWRANDWMWGRLDGSFHAVRASLNPERLRQLYDTPHEAAAAIRGLALALKSTDDDLRAELALGADEWMANVDEELMAVFAGGGGPQLTWSTRWITRRLRGASTNVLLQDTAQIESHGSS